MKFTYFELMPWPYLPDDFREKHHSVWVDIDRTLYDPVKGHAVYNEYLDMLEEADTLGFDGIGVNEHHQNAYGLMPSPNIIAAKLARRTSRSALVVLGNSIALYNPPIRVAEEFAMLDVISGGRLVAGFPVGTSMDTNFCYGTVPALTREKYAEAHELIMRAWHEDKPFAFNGRYTKLRYVNTWPKPMQQPHPPIHIPGGGSVETYDFCLDNTYSYSYLSLFWLSARQLGDEGILGASGGARDWTTRPIAPASPRSSASARPTPRPRGSMAARQLLLQPLPACLSGLRRCAGLSHHQDDQDGCAVAIFAATPNGRPLSWKDLIDDAFIIAGGPETVRQRLEELIKTLRVGNLFLLFHVGNMPKDLTHAFDPAVRRKGHAEAAEPLAGLRRRQPLLVPSAGTSAPSRRRSSRQGGHDDRASHRQHPPHSGPGAGGRQRRRSRVAARRRRHHRRPPVPASVGATFPRLRAAVARLWRQRGSAAHPRHARRHAAHLRRGRGAGAATARRWSATRSAA